MSILTVGNRVSIRIQGGPEVGWIILFLLSELLTKEMKQPLLPFPSSPHKKTDECSHINFFLSLQQFSAH